MKKTIRILIVATNSYFLLGIRFINRWHHLYKGKNQYIFHFVSDQDPKEYLADDIDNVIYTNINSKDWFSNNMSRISYFKEIANLDSDYVICVDADTNIEKPIFDNLFLYDSFFLQHIGREFVQIDNDKSVGYMNFINLRDEDFAQACFFGGTTTNVIKMCDYVIKCLELDKPLGNISNTIDEAYLTKYFYINKNYLSLKRENLPFFITDKGNERPAPSGWFKAPFEDLSPQEYQNLLLEVKNNKNNFFNIRNNKVVIDRLSAYEE